MMYIITQLDNDVVKQLALQMLHFLSYVHVCRNSAECSWSAHARRTLSNEKAKQSVLWQERSTWPSTTTSAKQRWTTVTPSATITVQTSLPSVGTTTVTGFLIVCQGMNTLHSLVSTDAQRNKLEKEFEVLSTADDMALLAASLHLLLPWRLMQRHLKIPTLTSLIEINAWEVYRFLNGIVGDAISTACHRLLPVRLCHVALFL